MTTLHDEIKLPPHVISSDHPNNPSEIWSILEMAWIRHRDLAFTSHARHAAAELAIASDARIEALEAALADARKELESWAFESWLERTCPSGDVEEVQRQWENSDFMTRNALKGQP